MVNIPKFSTRDITTESSTSSLGPEEAEVLESGRGSLKLGSVLCSK